MNILKRLFGSSSSTPDSSKSNARFPGYRRYELGQTEPDEFVRMVSQAVIPLQEGRATTTICFFGFDEPEEVDHVLQRQSEILKNASLVVPLPFIQNRNYQIRVEYPQNIPCDAILRDAASLKNTYNATDVSMLPIPMSKMSEMHRIFEKKRCKFLAAIPDGTHFPQAS